MNILELLILDSKRYGSRNFIKIFFKDIRFRCNFYFRLLCCIRDYKFLYALRIFLKNRLIRLGLDITENNSIGPGLKFVHLGNIVIHSNTIIGKNATLLDGVTFAQKNRKSTLAPIIGDNVYIGKNTIICGNVILGDNVTLDAGLYIRADIPNNSKIYNDKAITKI
jgi:serine O-acetyltransferase